MFQQFHSFLFQKHVSKRFQMIFFQNQAMKCSLRSQAFEVPRGKWHQPRPGNKLKSTRQNGNVKHLHFKQTTMPTMPDMWAALLCPPFFTIGGWCPHDPASFLTCN
jgi:hypothetical protein